MPIYTFTTLNDPAAVLGTYVMGINDSGQVSGQRRTDSFNSHGD
jgi:hypothetical protein